MADNKIVTGKTGAGQQAGGKMLVRQQMPTPQRIAEIKAEMIVKKVGPEEQEDLNDLLFIASRKDNVERMLRLIRSGADINAMDADGNTVLAESCRNCSWFAAHILISLGAKVGVQNMEGQTDLMWASYNGNLDVVMALVGKGAGVHQLDDNGRNPVHYAEMCGRGNVKRYLEQDCSAQSS